MWQIKHSSSNPFDTFSSGSNLIELPSTTYIISQDIAQTVDDTCTAVFRVTPEIVKGSAEGRITYYLDKIYLSLQKIKYTELPIYTRELMDAFSVNNDVTLVVDGTGVGLPVFDMYDEAGLDPLKIVFTSGNNVSTQRGIRSSFSKFGQIQGFAVPKDNLKDSLVLAMEQGIIRRARNLDYKAQEELQYKNFVGRFNEKTKYVKYGNSEDKIHDDIICADMMASWIFQHTTRERRRKHIESSSFSRDPFGDLNND